jgi:putative spermidine/putrescine transport system permease protein
MALPIYASPLERIWHYTYLVLCTAIFIFLISPILVIIPLSFNAEPNFTFTEAMLTFDPAGYSWRWYDTLLTLGMHRHSYGKEPIYGASVRSSMKKSKDYKHPIGYGKHNNKVFMKQRAC